MSIKKGRMDDLISRTAVIEYLMTNMGWHDEDGYEVDDADDKRAVITDLINGIPAVDAAQVVHGQWKDKYWTTDYDWGVFNHRAIVCSACYNEIYKGEKSLYCPNCGAKMDEECPDYEAAVAMMEYCERYEPTYNSEDGSM